MITSCVRQCPEESDTYEWELQTFLSLDTEQVSETFIAQGYLWRLVCFPRQNANPNKHISLFLEYPAAQTTTTALTDRLPAVNFTLTVVNHKDSLLHISKGTNHRFEKDMMDWGFSQIMPLSSVSIDSGFLRDDGTLVVRLQIKLQNERNPCLRNGTARSLGADFLALLKDPGPTSDLTLTAGGRSFPVHRAILAARCEFFKTMFASGFDDSASKHVPMPDTDPDALQLLLRFIYGGVLDSCPQALLKPAAELADRWWLAGARAELEECILNSASADSIVNDMLWAEVHGSEALNKALQEDFLRGHAGMDEKAVSALAERSPKLAASLINAALARIREGSMQH